MKIIGLQFDIAWENPQVNFETIGKMIEKNPPEANSLLILPEMFATGFTMNAELARQAGKPSEQLIADISTKYNCYTVGGLVENAADGHPYNYACIRNPDGSRALRYKKIHQFGDERNHYAAGHRVCTAKINAFSVCPLICYDLRFPETFRQATNSGVDIFVVIASWPTPRIEHWKSLLKARAIENQAYVVGINRIGKAPTNEYDGQSLIFDYAGNEIAYLDNKQGFISADLSLDELNQYRAKYPFLHDITNNITGCFSKKLIKGSLR